MGEPKARFGQGYYLEVTLRNELNVPAMHDFVKQQFPGSQQRECFSVYLRYFLPNTSSDGKEVRLSSLFKLLENRKHDLDISDYSVSQPTLEQVCCASHYSRVDSEPTHAGTGVLCVPLQ